MTDRSIRDHLFQPEQFKGSDEVFQDAVARLLSLIGLSVITLGGRSYKRADKKRADKFEVLRLESGFAVGSADLIAYRENEQLLFIDCTTKIPDDNKVKNLQVLVNYFLSIKEELKYPMIFSLIFTPKSWTYRYQRNVGVAGRSRIERLLDLALEGKPGQAIDRSIDPRRDFQSHSDNSVFKKSIDRIEHTVSLRFPCSSLDHSGPITFTLRDITFEYGFQLPY